MIKFNRLIRTMNESLFRIKKAIQGFIVMSPDLDDMCVFLCAQFAIAFPKL